jgi:hypothetical protein
MPAPFAHVPGPLRSGLLSTYRDPMQHEYHCCMSTIAYLGSGLPKHLSCLCNIKDIIYHLQLQRGSVGYAGCQSRLQQLKTCEYLSEYP